MIHIQAYQHAKFIIACIVVRSVNQLCSVAKYKTLPSVHTVAGIKKWGIVAEEFGQYFEVQTKDFIICLESEPLLARDKTLSLIESNLGEDLPRYDIFLHPNDAKRWIESYITQLNNLPKKSIIISFLEEKLFGKERQKIFYPDQSVIEESYREILKKGFFEGSINKEVPIHGFERYPELQKQKHEN